MVIMTKVLSINTFGALVSSLCTFIFKKRKKIKRACSLAP